MTKPKALTELDIHRRIKFLLHEAASEHPVRDQTVTFAMRVISNFCVVQQDASSSFVKKKSPWMSRKAWELKGKISEKDWCSLTVNEHQEPLKQVWGWILGNAQTLRSDEVLDRFRKWPMVTVTTQEDALLRARSSQGPDERYADIEVGKVEDRDWRPR